MRQSTSTPYKTVIGSGVGLAKAVLKQSEFHIFALFQECILDCKKGDCPFFSGAAPFGKVSLNPYPPSLADRTCGGRIKDKHKRKGTIPFFPGNGLSVDPNFLIEIPRLAYLVSNPKRHYRTITCLLVVSNFKLFQILKGIIGHQGNTDRTRLSLVSNPKRHYRTSQLFDARGETESFKS